MLNIDERLVSLEEKSWISQTTQSTRRVFISSALFAATMIACRQDWRSRGILRRTSQCIGDCLSLAASLELLLLRIQFQRDGVDAVAQTCGFGAVRKDMTEVRSAAAAGHFSSAHPMAVILIGLDIFF